MFSYDTAIIQLGQGARGVLEAHATMVHIASGTRLTLQLEFDDLGTVPTDGLPADFLYAALSRIAENFDDHQVVGMEVTPYQPNGS